MKSQRNILHAWISFPSIWTACVVGLSGVAFLTANLLLARRLSVEQYALISLVVTLLNVATPVAPLGIDGVINRRSLTIDGALLRRVLLTSTIVALIAIAVGMAIYRVSPLMLGLLFIAVIAGGTLAVVAAKFQSMQAFGKSLFFLHSPNLALLAASAVTLLKLQDSALIPFSVFAVTLVAMAFIAWIAAGRTGADPATCTTLNWREAAAYLSVQFSAGLLVQLERLLTPALLSFTDLATLGVVLAVIGPPFRLLQLTAGYSLLPRLRRAADSAERIRLLTTEGLLALAIVVVCSILLWFCAPLLIELLLHEKYSIGRGVLVAALVSGMLKVASGFAKACITAIADNRGLAHVGLISWIGIVIAVLGASFGARYGLSGVIYGVSTGWAIRVIATLVIVRRHLRHPPAA